MSDLFGNHIVGFLTRRLIFHVCLSQDGAHCISIHKDGDIAAVGCTSGKWFALDLDSHRIIKVYEDAKEQIECISFSPGMTYSLLQC